jgi:hypothetical protein
MLREGFISFEKSTLTLYWLANAIPTSQPYRLASQLSRCHSQDVKSVIVAELYQDERRGCTDAFPNQAAMHH